MKLPNPRQAYTARDEIERNRAIEAADKQNHKRRQDVEVGDARLILTSPNGTRYSVDVDNAGNLSTSAV